MITRFKASVIAVVLAAVLSTASCISDGFTEAVNEAVAALDQGKDDLLVQSMDWQLTLENITKGLSKDARDLIQNDIDQLLTRSVGAAATGVMCVIDMISERVAEGLEKIKARLLKEKYTQPLATVCFAAPSDISLGAPAETRQKVTLDGYDFDEKSPPKVEHVTGTGGPADVSGILTIQTRYRATLNIGQVPLGPDSQAIRVSGTRGTVTIPVIQAPPPKCRSKEDNSAPASVTVPATLLRGDPEFFGNGPLTSVGFSMQNLGSSIRATLGITAQEQFQHPLGPVGTYLNGDTYAENQTSWSIYEPPPGWHVISFQPSGTFEGYTSRDNSTGPEIQNSKGGTVLKSWTIVGDINGIDVGVANGTSVAGAFGILTVQIAENPGVGGCVA